VLARMSGTSPMVASLTGIVAVALAAIGAWVVEREKALSGSTAEHQGDGHLGADTDNSMESFWLWALATNGGVTTIKPIASVRTARLGSSAQRVARTHSRIKPLRVLMPRKLALGMSNCVGRRVPEWASGNSVRSCPTVGVVDLHRRVWSAGSRFGYAVRLVARAHGADGRLKCSRVQNNATRAGRLERRAKIGRAHPIR
jgi:hypothetical protein